MQRIPVPISAAQLGTSASTLYTAPAATTATINNLALTNTTTSPVAVTVYRVPSGGSASASNMIVCNYSLAANQTYVPPAAIGQHLSPGMTLQALAGTASAVTVTGGVYETSGSA